MMDEAQIPNELIEQIYGGKCVLFVGAGLSLGTHGQKGLPSGSELARELALRCQACAEMGCDFYKDGGCSREEGCSQPLQRVAAYYDNEEGRQALIAHLRKRIEAVTEPLRAHRAIARLPIRVIITTNYDQLLEWAFPRGAYHKVVHGYDVSYMEEENKVQLIKMHGCITDPESIIITEEDYADFFARLPTISTILQYYFATKPLLFMGYGLADENFKRLYREITRQVNRHKRRAYAVQWRPTAADVRLWKRENLMVLDADATLFLERLGELVWERAEEERKEIEPAILPERPYKFLDYFETEDAPIFFGREDEAGLLHRRILAHKLTVLFGRSGVGKTSLIKAGVIPRLLEEGYEAVYTRPLHDDPSLPIKEAVMGLVAREEAGLSPAAHMMGLRSFLEEVLPDDCRLVIFLDQFEEFFLRLGDEVRTLFARELADCFASSLDLRFVLSLRNDYFDRLDELSAQLPDIYKNRFSLKALDEEKAEMAIFKPAERFGLTYEDDLLRALQADLVREGIVEPPQLQIVCYKLYEDLLQPPPVQRGVPETSVSTGGLKGKVFTLAAYRRLGGAKRILADYLDDALTDIARELSEEESEEAREARFKAIRDQAQAILKSMVTPEKTKLALAAQEIARDEIVRRLELDEATVGRLLRELQDRRVIRWLQELGSYELAHECMVDKVWEWISEEDARLKYVRGMLRQDLNNYRRLGLLMGRDRLEVVNEHREELSLSAEELELLFRSALVAGYEVDYWFQQAKEGNVAVLDILYQGLTSEEPNARADAAAILGQIGSEETVDWLRMALDDDYPHVRARAWAALRAIGTERALLILRDNPPKGMILIPAGEFIMGDDRSQYEDEKPAHRIYVEAFYIDKHPVTNAEYKKFVDCTGHPAPYHWRGGYPEHKADHPVVYVNWFDARAYAQWAGKRLPTEAEWEKAASWDDKRKVKRPYPWGDEFDKNKCNTWEGGPHNTTSVGSYSKKGGDSPYGVCDMAGNVWEWTSSLKKDYPYRADDGREEVDAPGFRALRGGSWNDVRDDARGASRYDPDPDLAIVYYGLRCVVGAV